MAYKRKYRQGTPVKSIEDFPHSPETQYFFWHGKTVHKQVFMHWQLDMLIREIGVRRLYFADTNVPADGDTE
jgi:hypothetical protein|uniref:Uncharacterized protein n=1 Tax=Siphoviridae sp. ctoiW10 TaxID=2827592 RepID=A0A8S5LP33_9CAUD|nr:MAG TPA: hypothetical protein [Siphoviridae sp. ctoiW10]